MQSKTTNRLNLMMGVRKRKSFDADSKEHTFNSLPGCQFSCSNETLIIKGHLPELSQSLSTGQEGWSFVE